MKYILLLAVLIYEVAHGFGVLPHPLHFYRDRDRRDPVDPQLPCLACVVERDRLQVRIGELEGVLDNSEQLARALHQAEEGWRQCRETTEGR